MSKLIATRAIQGAHKLVDRAERELRQALEQRAPDTSVKFPNTAYYLPISYGMLGMKIDTLAGLNDLLDEARRLLPPIPADERWLPFLGHTLDAGMATLFADEIIEAIKYTREPLPYCSEANPSNGTLWLGAANDVIMRARGIEFVDGSAPGFAACVGSCRKKTFTCFWLPALTENPWHASCTKRAFSWDGTPAWFPSATTSRHVFTRWALRRARPSPSAAPSPEISGRF